MKRFVLFVGFPLLAVGLWIVPEIHPVTEALPLWGSWLVGIVGLLLFFVLDGILEQRLRAVPPEARKGLIEPLRILRYSALATLSMLGALLARWAGAPLWAAESWLLLGGLVGGWWIARRTQ